MKFLQLSYLSVYIFCSPYRNRTQIYAHFSSSCRELPSDVSVRQAAREKYSLSVTNRHFCGQSYISRAPFLSSTLARQFPAPSLAHNFDSHCKRHEVSLRVSVGTASSAEEGGRKSSKRSIIYHCNDGGNWKYTHPFRLCHYQIYTHYK